LKYRRWETTICLPSSVQKEQQWQKKWSKQGRNTNNCWFFRLFLFTFSVTKEKKWLKMFSEGNHVNIADDFVTQKFNWRSILIETQWNNNHAEQSFRKINQETIITRLLLVYTGSHSFRYFLNNLRSSDVRTFIENKENKRTRKKS